MRELLRASFAAGALALGAAGGAAQSLDTPVRGFGGIDLLVARPTGQFAENVNVGGGIGIHGRLAFDDSGVFSLRGDLGFINYGNETIRICVTQPCRVTGNLTTSNNIVFAGLGPEITLGSQAAHAYGHGSAGFAYFGTTSSVEGSGNQGDPFAQSTNFDDVTFAWMAGGGTRFRLSGGNTPVWLDLGARYHGNGEAEYLRKGDIQDLPDGSVRITPRRSDTNFWTFRFGITIGFRPGMGEGNGW